MQVVKHKLLGHQLYIIKDNVLDFGLTAALGIVFKHNCKPHFFYIPSQHFHSSCVYVHYCSKRWSQYIKKKRN